MSTLLYNVCTVGFQPSCTVDTCLFDVREHSSENLKHEVKVLAV